jgi:signal transduction histidine kinase
MKIWFKIYLMAFSLSLVVLYIAMGLSIYDTQKRELERETQRSLNEHRMIMDSLLTSMEAYSPGQNYLPDTISRAVRIAIRFSSQLDARFIVYDGAENPLYYTSGEDLDKKILPLPAKEGYISHILLNDGVNQEIAVSGIIMFSNQPYTILYLRDISRLYIEGQQLGLRTSAIICAAMLLLGTGLFFLVRSALKPLTNLRLATGKIAHGSYNIRADVKGNDEISALAVDFNHMADAVAEHVNELSQKTKAQEIFISNLAHELKTPMTSIAGYADLMLRMELPKDRQETALRHIGTESKRLEKLSEKLMQLIMITGDSKIELKEQPLPPILESAVSAVRDRAHERGVDIEMDYGLDYLACDRDLMCSLVINLLDNACKASKPGTTVCIRTHRTYDGIAVIEVSDQGAGIPKAELGHIFSPFYMVDRSRSGAENGRGLGLSLCAAIAKCHNARLSAYSEEGVGTSMKLSMKLAVHTFERNLMVPLDAPLL